MSNDLMVVVEFWKKHFGSDLPEEAENQLLAVKMLGLAVAKGDTNPEVLTWIAQQSLPIAMGYHKNGEHAALEEYLRLRASGVAKEEAIREMTARHVRVTEAYANLLIRLCVDQVDP